MEHSKVCKTTAIGIEENDSIFHKAVFVKPLKDFILGIVFEDGSVKTYDVCPLFSKWEAFLDLRDSPCLFMQVKIESGGYAISWNDEIDLSCTELRDNGKA
jgi:hypothetical protein